MKILSLKIYVDTFSSYRDGVPRLLDICSELGVEASFFFGMGTENTGSAFSKILREDREIVASAPGILRDALKRGQDCGIYGLNPLEWRNRLEKIKDTTLESDIKKAIEYFARRTGCRPGGFAAPGCRVNYMSLRIQDDLRLDYCSDTFGFYPFLPRLSWKVFATPQIPSTLPPVEVIMKRIPRAEMREGFSKLADSMGEGLNVLPLNAAVANDDVIRPPFYEFLRRVSENGVKFMSLGRVIRSIDVKSLEPCEIIFTKAFGISNEIAVQSVD
ncbi:MAG: polysaccharide deacetylase family protein [Synergistaceae bacterium]|nr:polysaccharide deacetylase family protein [Synergistaceae bacterium]